MSEMMQDRAIVTMEHEYDTAHKLSNSTSLDDLEWPLTHISRWQYYATSTNSKVIVTDLSEIPKALWNNKSVQLFVQNFELVSKGRGKDGSEKKEVPVWNEMIIFIRQYVVANNKQTLKMSKKKFRNETKNDEGKIQSNL